MRDFATKTDGVSNLTAAEFNNYIVELENAVTTSGQTLNQNDPNQLGQAMANYAIGSAFYVDSSLVANAYQLSPVSANRQSPSTLSDGMQFFFIAQNSSTGDSTINITGLGSSVPVYYLGEPLSTNGVGLIQADELISVVYRALVPARFELTSLPIVQPSFKFQIGLANEMGIQIDVGTNTAGTGALWPAYATAPFTRENFNIKDFFDDSDSTFKPQIQGAYRFSASMSFRNGNAGINVNSATSPTAGSTVCEIVKGGTSGGDDVIAGNINGFNGLFGQSQSQTSGTEDFNGVPAEENCYVRYSMAGAYLTYTPVPVVDAWFPNAPAASLFPYIFADNHLSFFEGFRT